MSTETLEAPRYRIVGEAPFYHHSSFRLYQPGEELAWDGWPSSAALSPVNESARRLSRYYGRHGGSPGLPATPWSITHRTWYLPGLSLAFHGKEPCGLVADQDADPALGEMPEYTTTRTWWHGRYEIEAGERVKFIGWAPAEPTFEHPLKPANGAARAVVAYVRENFAHPDIPPRGPWCWFNGLWLPKLSPAAEKSYATSAYPDGSYRPLDTTKYADAIASEVASVTGKRPGEPGSIPPTYPSGTPSRINRANPRPDRPQR